jgi:myo-inositol 2-dehydrogenase/D-chiro-inositol 1-dehydrogenase
VIGVGVVGAGTMGRYFIETISDWIPEAKVIAVASRTAHAGGPRLTHETGLELIGDPAVDAVIVASPDETHEELVLACLEARKPVLCEKPLAPTSSECRRIVEAEARLGRRYIQVGYMRRFDPAFAALKSAVDRRGIGAPLMLHCSHRAPGPSRNRSTDLLMSNAAVHDIDAVRWLLAQEISSATVYLPPAVRLNQAKYDPLLIVLRTTSETVVDVEIFVNAGYGCEIRTEVLCEYGTIALAGPHLIAVKHDGNESLTVPRNSLATFRDAYRAELKAWIQSVSEGDAIAPNAWDGFAATAVSDACRRSIATGEPAKVELGERPSLYADNDIHEN